MRRALVAPAGFAVAVVVLVLAGRGQLATPPVDGFGAWIDRVGPVTAAMALVRLAALGAAGWMLVVTTVGVLARLAGAQRLALAADHVMPASVRRALTVLAGAGAAGTVLLGAADSPTIGLAAPAPSTEVLVRLPAEGEPPAEAETATMSVLADAGQPAAADWVVEPGESFWSIADTVLGEAWGRAPTAAEVVPYWRSLIEANRDRLVTADPDLIHPGQVFTLPAAAPPPA